ncbi:sugar ABC transporter substrate-binding protein [bacterium]|nr:MAG: sugar ABC transporter substrate-binding protein [bacterium]
MTRFGSLSALAAVAVGLVSLVACGGGGASGSGSNKTFTIGEINAGLQYPYAAAIGTGIKNKAQALGVKVIELDSKGKVETEASNVQDLIAQKVDLIILQPNDGAAAQREVAQIRAAGIPVMAVHTQVGTSDDPANVYSGLFAYVTQGEVQVGATAGALALQALPSGGQIAIVEGSGCCFVAVHQRSQGFLDAIHKGSASFTVVATQPGAWTPEGGRSACQNMLTAHPTIQLVYAMSQDMAAGCGQALSGLASKPKVVGVGIDQPTANLIKDGTIYGTVCQRPVTLGELAMSTAYDQLTGQTHYDRKYISLPTPAITQANLSDCPVQF